MYKIIAMDFDGTLLTSDKKVSDRTKKILLKLKKAGYLIIGVTARNLLSVKNTLDINMFNYIVLNNGANIFAVEKNQIEVVGVLDNNVVKNITHQFENEVTEIDYCTSEHYYIKSKERLDKRDFVVYIEDIKEIKEPILRINLFFNQDNDIKNGKNIIKDDYSFVNVIEMVDTDNVNSKKWLTINPKSINKFSTLKTICDKENCKISEVIFFGDGENDMTLIENVGLSVAMGNALEIVKRKAKKVTLTNDKDGVAAFLEDFIQ